MSITRGVLSNANSHTVILTRRLNTASRETCLNIVSGHRPTERNVVAVTCDLSAERFVDRWSDYVGAPPLTCGIVDVGERTRPTVSGVDPDQVRTVSDPGNLQHLHDAVEAHLNELPDADRTVVYLDTVNALLDHVPIPSVTGFLDRLTSSLSALGAVSCASFETGKRGERMIRPVTETFGTVFELGRLGRSLEPTDDQLSSDDVFDVLSSRSQRLVLRSLLRAEGTLHVRELAQRIAAAQTTEQPDIEQIVTRLHHIDLPKLRETGLVAVEDRVVSATEVVTEVEPYLALAHPDERN
ncbi:DUF7504 family protein [Halostella pelagica]